MKRAAVHIARLLCANLIIGAGTVSADTVVFTKPDSADWTLPENQDRITNNVWITRKDIQSLFNIAQEDGYSGSNGSPVGTQWSDTVTAVADSASYTNFVAMHGGGPQSLIGDTVSLYLPQDGLYYDVTFLTYSGGNTGGGFSYSRTSIMLGADKNEIPTEFSLSGNYPNPFNSVTTIAYDLPQAAFVELVIYDLLGQRVTELQQGRQEPGTYHLRWNGTTDKSAAVSTGTYFYRLHIETFVTTRKMVLLK